VTAPTPRYACESRADPDVKGWCNYCRGPVYYDERGSVCPDCRRIVALRNRVCGHLLPRPKRLYHRAPVEREGDADRADAPEPAVLYGLLTANDVRELERRREKFGAYRRAG
jgi:hypothetical protein